MQGMHWVNMECMCVTNIHFIEMFHYTQNPQHNTHVLHTTQRTQHTTHTTYTTHTPHNTTHTTQQTQHTHTHTHTTHTHQQPTLKRIYLVPVAMAMHVYKYNSHTISGHEWIHTYVSTIHQSKPCTVHSYIGPYTATQHTTQTYSNTATWCN